MPYLKIETNRILGDIEIADLKSATENILIEVMGKPLARIMTSVDHSDLNFGGTNQACAYAQLQSLGGLSKEVNDELCVKISEALHTIAHIPPERIFINFVHFERDHWGGNEGTFA